MEKKQPIKSSVLKCGKKTYFFDIYLASNDKKYIKINESSFVGENGERKRNTFLLFQEDLVNFQTRLSEIAGEMS
ncbi:MAG: hypothetical protein ACD_31C00008G0021 [uncultured bacterium]|uniref:DUF3276 family protein n=2 Tax=Candidatus Daviesiibacteriota TaxID=1752718 RepID=A0A1F5K1L8_9BACT|nr:MAG: hypothetical protein ACD_31C00008G0021 [uncultured bacterium]OGE16699.1 MAG: hypothetical protein A2858_02585 [Candidatus Daviesbacteria bacterium RIFCSPHIGHO2_01_FULL_36_37]OGE34776.1 MAG: hypothetical protein A3E66_04105 [Candidatus Daviesbacteria bacterium RIFCSPHIGHO2_12_FULL_37_16]